MVAQELENFVMAELAGGTLQSGCDCYRGNYVTFVADRDNYLSTDAPVPYTREMLGNNFACQRRKELRGYVGRLQEQRGGFLPLLCVVEQGDQFENRLFGCWRGSQSVI